MMKRVCNALNTSDYDMIDGMDCIDYWSVSKNEKARYCRVSRKEETPDDKLVGGHVILSTLLYLTFTLYQCLVVIMQGRKNLNLSM